MFRLARYLKPFRKYVIIGPIFKLTEAIFELIVPLVMASIIDVGIKNQDREYVLRMGGVMVLLGVLGLLFALICQYSAARASQGFGTVLRNEMFAHINTFSHAEIDKLGSSSLITRIVNDVNQLQVAVAMLIRLVIRAPFLVIGAAVMAMRLDLRLSVIFLIVAPLVALVLYVIMSRSVPYYKVRQAKLDKVSLITKETLEGARVIRAFSRQEKEKARFMEASEDVTEIAMRVGKISAFLNPATFAILNIAIVAIVWFGGYRVESGAMTQGEIIAFVNYMTQISLALVVVANLVVTFTKAGASAVRVNEVLDTQASVVEGSVTESPKTDSGIPKISFRDVSFAYPGASKHSLEHVTVDIMEGETVGIIGGTGSGKSTLINLMPRFYDISEGELLIDGIPVKDYTFAALRGQFGVVPQRAELFRGTILENMRWAKADAGEEEIREAVEAAQAADVVAGKEEGYQSMIMEGGKNLSGGQKQRLTIARALVGKPKILILDDSSSALDYATDAKLRKAIREFSRDMTVFIVSQRANSIRHADKIIVLDDGRVAGIGTHRDLFETCGIYREICLSQLSKEEAMA